MVYLETDLVFIKIVIKKLDIEVAIELVTVEKSNINIEIVAIK